MSKRELIRILETFGYYTNFPNEWKSGDYPNNKGCISFNRDRKIISIRFNYGNPMLLSDLTHPILFNYMITMGPGLKTRIRDWKLNNILNGK